MEGSLADELYSQVLRPNSELGHMSVPDSKQCDSHDGNGDELWCEDESSRNDAIEELDNVSDLDREWQRRRNQFHTVGYRDGLMAGKEASAQEGFNVGFKESVFVGLNWGLVRGVASALACLSDGLKERMVETKEKREKFGQLYESVRSLSTTDALKLFHDDLSNKNVKQSDTSGCTSPSSDSRDPSSDRSPLDYYYGELQSLISESPAIKVHLAKDH